MKKHTIEQLKSLLSYSPENGSLTWKYRDVSMFRDSTNQTASAACNGFNTAYGGQPALVCVGNHGYRHGVIQRVRYLAHHVCWAIHTGEWANEEIDHINGDRLDNRIANLRAVSRSENCKNLSMRSDNTSGHTGIDFVKKRNKWRARIGNEQIGYFESISLAIEAREVALIGNGYAKDHGKRVIS